jgi:hypothetical protein
MGFARCVMPHGNLAAEDAPEGLEIASVRTVGEALETLMEW